MNKMDKLSKDLKAENDFIKGYLGEEDFWILVTKADEIKCKVTKKYKDIVKQYFTNKNVLIINQEDEKDLLMDIDKKDYKIIYK